VLHEALQARLSSSNAYDCFNSQGVTYLVGDLGALGRLGSLRKKDEGDREDQEDGYDESLDGRHNAGL
jgi:hypothetical protein